MIWLVTGGAGYIGCHVVRTVHASGTRVVVVLGWFAKRTVSDMLSSAWQATAVSAS